VRTGEAVELVRDLRAGELDLVLSETEPPASAGRGLAVTVLDRPLLVAAGDPSIEPLADWSNVAFIHYRPTSAFHWDVEAFLQARGLRPRLAAEADDASLLLEAASQAAFVVFVPRAMVGDSVAQGRLKVLAQLDAGQAVVHALHRDDAASELVDRVLGLLRESARGTDGALPPVDGAGDGSRDGDGGGS
jgi:DNA-binding transcriptional LysR family regulator